MHTFLESPFQCHSLKCLIHRKQGNPFLADPELFSHCRWDDNSDLIMIVVL